MFAYRPPSADILNCRRAFHTSQKGSTESTTDWFQRLSKLSGACEYASIADIILIDKFLSGIDANFYPRIVNETYLDANKLLTIALDIEEAAATIGNNANHDVSMKIETDDGLHQENEFVWFAEDTDQYSFDEDEEKEEANDDEEIEVKPFDNPPSVDKSPAKQPPKKKRFKDGENHVVNEKNRVVCLKCVRSYSSKKSFLDHFLAKHPENCLPCPKCATLYPTTDTLKRHLAHHPSNEKYLRNFECYVCRTNFCDLYGLQGHLTREHKVNTIYKQCSICDKPLRTAVGYERHMAMHNGAPFSYTCEFCGKIFSRQIVWKRHLLIHTNARNHVCDQCGASYTRKDRLQRHTLKHTGERPHKCTLCPSAFRLRETLKTHQTIHTGERPYVCPYAECGKTFARGANFTKHKRTVHEKIRQFACTMCDKKFLTKDHLQRHINVHNGVKLHRCPCGVQYAQKSSLVAHAAKCVHPSKTQ